MSATILEQHHARTGGSGQPWDLSRAPNYENAMPVETILAENLSQEDFYRKYVTFNRPLLIRGAASHWPAFTKWRSIDNLKRGTKNSAMQARSAPLSEFAEDADADIKAKLQKNNREIFKCISFHQFLERASKNPEQLVLHSIPLIPGGALGELCEDVGWYAFLSKWKGSRFYPRIRAFFYRNSYTDWHFHPADETLMTQVVGTKEALLLPPDDNAWDALYQPAIKTGYLYNIDPEKFPKFFDVKPYRAVVRPGDALYIPVYWWHAVASADDQFGITVASTFKSPVHVNADLRYPAARYVMKRFLFSRLAPIIIIGVAYAFLHRAIFSVFGGKKNR